MLFLLRRLLVFARNDWSRKSEESLCLDCYQGFRYGINNNCIHKWMLLLTLTEWARRRRRRRRSRRQNFDSFMMMMLLLLTQTFCAALSSFSFSVFSLPVVDFPSFLVSVLFVCPSVCFTCQLLSGQDEDKSLFISSRSVDYRHHASQSLYTIELSHVRVILLCRLLLYLFNTLCK